MADPTAHHHGHRHSHGHDHGDGTCDHARERSARVPVAMAEAAESCEKRNLRLTPIRRQVLEALYASHRPASAYELIETLATGGEKTHAPSPSTGRSTSCWTMASRTGSKAAMPSSPAPSTMRRGNSWSS